MKKAFKVVMLPSKEESGNIVLIKNWKQLYFNETPHPKSVLDTDESFQHLYIISTDEIKIGDFILHTTGKWISQCTNVDDYIHHKTKDGTIGNQSKNMFCKIIASTDRLLTPNSWIPDSYINDYVASYNLDNIIKYAELEVCEEIVMAGGLLPSNEIGGKGNHAITSEKIATNSDGSVLINRAEYIQKVGRVQRNSIQEYTKEQVIELMFASSHKYYEMGNIDSVTKKLKTQSELREDFDQYIKKL